MLQLVREPADVLLLIGRRAADRLHPGRDHAVLSTQVTVTNGLRVAGGRRLGELRLALAIEGDARVFQTADERAVGEAVLARGGVDPYNPQAAKIALLPATADESVFEGRVDRLFRGTIELALIGVIAFRQPEQL